MCGLIKIHFMEQKSNIIWNRFCCVTLLHSPGPTIKLHQDFAEWTVECLVEFQL